MIVNIPNETFLLSPDRNHKKWDTNLLLSSHFFLLVIFLFLYGIFSSGMRIFEKKVTEGHEEDKRKNFLGQRIKRTKKRKGGKDLNWLTGKFFFCHWHSFHGKCEGRVTRCAMSWCLLASFVFSFVPLSKTLYDQKCQFAEVRTLKHGLLEFSCIPCSFISLEIRFTMFPLLLASTQGNVELSKPDSMRKWVISLDKCKTYESATNCQFVALYILRCKTKNELKNRWFGINWGPSSRRFSNSQIMSFSRFTIITAIFFSISSLALYALVPSSSLHDHFNFFPIFGALRPRELGHFAFFSLSFSPFLSKRLCLAIRPVPTSETRSQSGSAQKNM